MDRLTKFWGNGEYGLVNAFETTNIEVCNALGRYEDDAERREKGCGYCNGLTVTGSHRLEDEFWGPLNYCPMCGRKLAEK